MSGRTQFTYAGGLATLKPALHTQGGAPGSLTIDFGEMIHRLAIHNGLGAVIYLAWDHEQALDATTPADPSTPNVPLAAATPGDWPIAAGADFAMDLRARRIFLYLPAAAKVNDTASGAVVVLGARGGVVLDF